MPGPTPGAARVRPCRFGEAVEPDLYLEPLDPPLDDACGSRNSKETYL
jgi:hypothetical protein